MLSDTKSERTKLPLRNMLTAFVLTGVGVWVITSSASLLAAGLCLGFSVRLFSEVISDADYNKWYWIFARKFNDTEHKGLMMAWGIILLWLWWIVVRG